ncbi:hypothetical protein GCM10027168_20060 [Streptomyces capparidis]
MRERLPEGRTPVAPGDEFDRELVASFRNDRLHLILLPTEQCNFRCVYCYEDFTVGHMRPEVVGAVKRLVDRRAGELAHLQVSWFGGEPLLARRTVEDVAAHAVAAMERHAGLRYESDMTTNGYLLDADAAGRLAALGVRAFQISLDGPRACHDRTRVRADGKGSFDRIWRNLLSVRRSPADVRIMLRVHLTPANVALMPEFLTRVRDTFLGDPRFSVFLKRVVRLGGPGDAEMDVLDPGDPRIEELRAIVLRDGTGDGSEAAAGNAGRLFTPDDVCYAARANSLMVRADGRVGKCTVALSDPANTIGQLLPDGTLRIDNALLRPWLTGWQSRDSGLTGCPYTAFTGPPRPLLQITPRPPEPVTPAPAGP